MKLKCYYCDKECEGFAFEQGYFSVFAHRNCAIEQIEKYGKLQKVEEPIRVTGICTICWENSTKDSKYADVCDKCLPLVEKK